MLIEEEYKQLPDSRIDNYNTISFVTPANWSDIRAFNGNIEKLVVVSTLLISGYKEAIVPDAGNGANWFITAIVDNRIPRNGGGAIPFGNYYLLFTAIVIVSLIYFKKRKHNSRYQ